MSANGGSGQMNDNLDLDWLVSVDDHVLEPPHVWQSRVPRRYREDAPRLVSDATGEYWVYQGRKVPTSGLSAVAGREREQFTPEPVPYSEMRPGCYDSVARLDDMDRAGILASMCFPSFPRFCGQVFYEGKDKELGLVCVKAYNEWMIEEWCGSAPGRYIPLILIPLWDPAEAAKELVRCAARGVHAFAFSENPSLLGLPSIHDRDRYWDPVWSAAQDAEVVVCMHQGSSSHRFQMSDDAPTLATMAWGIGSKQSGTMLDWLFGPVFQRYPGIKIALSEGGIGWMPYFLERAEQVLDKQRFWAAQGERTLEDGFFNFNESGVRSLVEVDPRTLDIRQTFRDHVYGCFIEDNVGLLALERIGVDNVMIETDYPHSDSTWPNCITIAHKQLSGFDEATRYKLLRGNAERLFHFTPPAPPPSSDT
jgi:predicted TIM-barrel fold metal-dependent hydrolase